MDFSKLPSNNLAQFAENVATLLGGTELSAIDSNVRTDLLTEIGTKPATLLTQEADTEVKTTQRNASFSERDATRESLLINLRQVRDALKTGLAPKPQYDMCGFDYDDGTKTTYVAQTPSELAVQGYSNGVNQGTFRGNNKSGSVLYEVWRREGDEGPWGLRMAVKKPAFIDEGVTPGQYYEYKVRARASKNVSLFSNSAVVYGMVLAG